MKKRQWMKTLMVFSVLALSMVLFAQHAMAAKHLIYRNTSNGGYAYLKLNSNGTLKNTTTNDGIGIIAASYPGTGFSYASATLNSGSDTKIIVSNSDGSRYAWMKLNENGTLANQTVNDGVAWINSAALSLSAWSMVGVQDNGSHSEGLNHVIFQNTSSGALGFVKLNANGTIKNETGNDGYGRINFGLDIPNSWSAFGIQENADGAGNDHILLRNTSTGGSAFVKLNSNGTMANATANDGYGVMGFTSTSYIPQGIETTANTGLVYRNSGGGTQSYAYVKLNANGTIDNLTRGNGWDFIQTTFDLSSFDYLGFTTINSNNMIMLRTSTGGRVAYIKLNANGTATNETVNDGVAWVSSDYSGAGWRAEGLGPDTYSD